ncbi:hypothetical protein QI045_05040 [Staphylococcus saprophyticus]|nr:hypothetical protein [Staphylococcus saprophyticus]
MKLLNIFSLICSIFIGMIIIYGVVMMVGDALGITTFNNQLLIVGLSLVLLSGLLRKSKPRLSTFVLFIGFIIVIIN